MSNSSVMVCNKSWSISKINSSSKTGSVVFLCILLFSWFLRSGRIQTLQYGSDVPLNSRDVRFSASARYTVSKLVSELNSMLKLILPSGSSSILATDCCRFNSWNKRRFLMYAYNKVQWVYHPISGRSVRMDYHRISRYEFSSNEHQEISVQSAQ